MERLIDVAVQQLSDLSEATSRIDATARQDENLLREYDSIY